MFGPILVNIFSVGTQTAWHWYWNCVVLIVSMLSSFKIPWNEQWHSAHLLVYRWTFTLLFVSHKTLSSKCVKLYLFVFSLIIEIISDDFRYVVMTPETVSKAVRISRRCPENFRKSSDRKELRFGYGEMVFNNLFTKGCMCILVFRCLSVRCNCVHIRPWKRVQNVEFNLIVDVIDFTVKVIWVPS